MINEGCIIHIKGSQDKEHMTTRTIVDGGGFHR